MCARVWCLFLIILVHENTLKKVKIWGVSDTKGKFKSFVPVNDVPCEYGGNLTFNCLQHGRSPAIGMSFLSFFFLSFFFLTFSPFFHSKNKTKNITFLLFSSIFFSFLIHFVFQVKEAP